MPYNSVKVLLRTKTLIHVTHETFVFKLMKKNWRISDGQVVKKEFESVHASAIQCGPRGKMQQDECLISR